MLCRETRERGRAPKEEELPSSPPSCHLRRRHRPSRHHYAASPSRTETRRRGGGGSLSSKLPSSLCKAAAIIIIAGCCCCTCDRRRLWVRHRRAEPLWRTVTVAEALVAVRSCSAAVWVTRNVAVITETNIGGIAIQYSCSSLSGIEFWVLHAKFYDCGIGHQAAALSPELPLLCSLAYL
ncbi:uncharacterized protein LOC107633648 [Arachis ipaensis]|uniref:uncharacterized protein LOC107633648 n=1 Tax=Arachis ipaensis TaxID=130454 RepID=UPI0007AF621D|nr:uncharacterized protein LOC107633648 [Arachis ipaensis]